MFVTKENQKFCKSMHILLQKIFFEELNDPIFRRVGINFLKLNSKRTLATIYLDIENLPKDSNVLFKLKTLTIFLKRRLSDELNVYKVPNLKFVDDTMFKQALRVEHLIDSDIKR